MDYFFRFLDLELLLNCLTEWQFILRVTVLSAPFLKIAGSFFAVIVVKVSIPVTCLNNGSLGLYIELCFRYKF